MKSKSWKRRLSNLFKRSLPELSETVAPMQVQSPTSYSFETGLDSHTTISSSESETELGFLLDRISVDSESLAIPPKVFKRRATLTGPSSWVPIGDFSAKKRGRFTIAREEVESSYWSPKAKTLDRPSRFYHGD